MEIKYRRNTRAYQCMTNSLPITEKVLLRAKPSRKKTVIDGKVVSSGNDLKLKVPKELHYEYK